MEIKISTQQIQKFLYIVTWIFFVAVCVEAGGFLFNSLYTQVYNPVGARYFWNHLDLSALYAFDKSHFFTITTLICIVALLKALMFSVILRFQFYKKLDLSKPFSTPLRQFTLNIGYVTFGIGLFSLWAQRYTDWVATKGVTLPAQRLLGIAGADVWFFMSITLFVISLILKRGIEIQSENDLTV